MADGTWGNAFPPSEQTWLSPLAFQFLFSRIQLMYLLISGYIHN